MPGPPPPDPWRSSPQKRQARAAGWIGSAQRGQGTRAPSSGTTRGRRRPAVARRSAGRVGAEVGAAGGRAGRAVGGGHRGGRRRGRNGQRPDGGRSCRSFGHRRRHGPDRDRCGIRHRQAVMTAPTVSRSGGRSRGPGRGRHRHGRHDGSRGHRRGSPRQLIQLPQACCLGRRHGGLRRRHHGSRRGPASAPGDERDEPGHQRDRQHHPDRREERPDVGRPERLREVAARVHQRVPEDEGHGQQRQRPDDLVHVEERPAGAVAEREQLDEPVLDRDGEDEEEERLQARDQHGDPRHGRGHRCRRERDQPGHGADDPDRAQADRRQPAALAPIEVRLVDLERLRRPDHDPRDQEEEAGRGGGTQRRDEASGPDGHLTGHAPPARGRPRREVVGDAHETAGDGERQHQPEARRR